MAAQSLKMRKGVGSFVVGNTELTPDSTIGGPYPSSAGTIDFTTRSTSDQDMLASSNHATTPQHTGPTTVGFLYSDFTT